MPVFRRPTFLGSNRAEGKHTKEIKNIVIFGETGVGKSSLVNLIADEKIAEISSSAVGCTLDHKCHLLTIEDQRFAMWDTAGLEEGIQEILPAGRVEAYLKQLLHDLAEASGIDLLIYCVRGTGVRSALLTNYCLFYSAICRKKVPIAIVITGLENQEGDMDSWWLKNERRLSALQMHFDNYACVTTLQPSMCTWNTTLRERRRTSRTTLIKMITSTCRTEQWKPTGRSWANTAFSDIRIVLSPRQGHGVHVANVIMCDISRNRPARPGVIKRSVTFHNPVTLSLSPSRTRSISFRSPVSVMNEKLQRVLPFDDAIKRTPERLFHVYQVPRTQTSSRGKDENMKDMVVKRGVDLLIFCVKKEGCGECRDVKLQWEHFNLTYGGNLSPQVVIVIGAMNQQSAEEWWKKTVGETATKCDASIAYWPRSKTVAETEAAKERIRDLIYTCCIDDCSKVNLARREPSHRLDKTGSIRLRMRPPVASSDKVDTVPIAHQDVLTKWGVWEHVSVGRDMITRSNTISHTFISGDNQEQDRLPFRPSL